MAFRDTKTPLKPKVKAKWQLEKVKNRYVLTPEQEKNLRRLYATEMNLTLMKWFGISHTSLHRLARKMGLKKDMNVIRKHHADQVRRTCEENGYYASLRGRVPQKALEAYKAKVATGWSLTTWLKENYPEKHAERARKARLTRIANMKKERRRRRAGLDARTREHMPQFNYSARERNQRYSAKARGYILGDYRENSGERYTIFFDGETRRSQKFEKSCEMSGFRFRELTINN